MNHNLAVPWSEKCSPPQRPEFAFYSRHSEDFLFPQQKHIEIICQCGVRSVAMTWSLTRDTFLKPFSEGVAEAMSANRFRIRLSTAQWHPGFYNLHVNLDAGNGKPITGICCLGYRASEMAVTDTRPDDFASFWRQARATLQNIPLKVRQSPMERFPAEQINRYNVDHAALPPDFDPAEHACEEVESCKVSFAGPDGGRVHGWLAKPIGPGPFPAMLVLPGGGFAARPRPLEHARHGFLALDIQVHGQEVDLPTYPQIPGHFGDCVYQPIQSYYYHAVHLRALQAMNYLAGHPDVDNRRIALCGGSQGGRLSVVVAALDQRVAAAIPAIAHHGNEPYRVWSRQCNGVSPADANATGAEAGPISDGMDRPGPPMPDATAANRCLAYYDTMNFAPDVRCPVLMNAGLLDPVSFPSGVFAIFNRLGTNDKQMIAMPGLAHDWSASFDRYAWRWLDQKMQGRSEGCGQDANSMIR